MCAEGGKNAYPKVIPPTHTCIYMYVRTYVETLNTVYIYVYTFFSKSLHFLLALLELKMEDLRRLFLSKRLARLRTEGRSRNTTEDTSVPGVATAAAAEEEEEEEEEGGGRGGWPLLGVKWEKID